MIEDTPFQNEYFFVFLVVGTAWGVLCEVLRASKCRFNSVGHFIFSDMTLCGHDVTVHVDINVPNETTALNTTGSHLDGVACVINI